MNSPENELLAGATLRWNLPNGDYVTLEHLPDHVICWFVQHITPLADQPLYTSAFSSYDKARQRVTQIREAKRIDLVPVTVADLNMHAQGIIRLVLKKNADYGDSWQKNGLPGVLLRMSDKIDRLNNLVTSDRNVLDESTADTLRDIAGYCLLGLLWIDHKNGEKE